MFKSWVYFSLKLKNKNQFLLPFFNQAFLSELYVFLVDQMHAGIGKVLSLEDETPVPAPLTDSTQLKHFAREAEVNEDFGLAAKYYQEVGSWRLNVFLQPLRARAKFYKAVEQKILLDKFDSLAEIWVGHTSQQR